MAFKQAGLRTSVAQCGPRLGRARSTNPAKNGSRRNKTTSGGRGKTSVLSLQREPGSKHARARQAVLGSRSWVRHMARCVRFGIRSGLGQRQPRRPQTGALRAPVIVAPALPSRVRLALAVAGTALCTSGRMMTSWGMPSIGGVISCGGPGPAKHRFVVNPRPRDVVF